MVGNDGFGAHPLRRECTYTMRSAAIAGTESNIRGYRRSARPPGLRTDQQRMQFHAGSHQVGRQHVILEHPVDHEEADYGRM